MKKFVVCKLCVIVFGTLLALQDAVAQEVCKRQGWQTNWQSIESETAYAKVTVHEGGIVTVRTTADYEKLKAKLLDGSEIILEPVGNAAVIYRAVDVPAAQVPEIDQAKWLGLKSRITCVENYTQKELEEQAIQARKLAAEEKRLVAKKKYQQLLYDRCVVEVFPDDSNAANTPHYESICKAIVLAISEDNARLKDQIRGQIKSRFLANALCNLTTLNGRSNIKIVESTKRLCANKTASVNDESPSSYSLKVNLPKAHLFLESNL